MSAPRRIALILGHPDPAAERFCAALAAAYETGAREAGHEVRRIEVGSMEFPLLRSAEDWKAGAVPAPIAAAQETLRWADHLVIVFPLWLGDMPALLKAFFEQAFRPGFAIGQASRGLPKKLLQGRSARVVVTMGMPAFFYRLFYRSHSVKSLKRNILELCGVAPVRTTLIGMVEGKAAARKVWLAELAALGAQAR